MLYLQFDILAALHPTPAVCGLPAEEARLLIKEIGKDNLFFFLCFFRIFGLDLHEYLRWEDIAADFIDAAARRLISDCPSARAYGASNVIEIRTVTAKANASRPVLEKSAFLR